MFSFFRKKNCIEIGNFNKMLIAVLEKLPSEYSIYLKQIKEGILRDVFPVTGYVGNHFGFSYQREVIKKYEKKGEKDYSITGIKIFNGKISKDVQLAIFFSYGVIAGVSSDDEFILSDLDLNKINIGFMKVKERTMDGAVKRELLSFGMQSFNESEVFEVNVEERRMLHVRELSDGDFLAVEDGDFYLISISLNEVLKISSAHYKTMKMNLLNLTEEDIYSFIQE
ncbi:hypothetical protein [Lysinibacillus odysseyi]|uniref:Uncharacterized protein n=1 Tax=Lysinibacillus odysseyi 34hs-1 = NBRC 100172 TaxID=1220589 RepID=A0A0A3J441_9BACI|nr:hypothetical protein [Lysinibacillus odysseyi]KGR81792.1 hypothetical protein CD32_20905 [Lysinibacillus odysseyi 34hs-1 = NBRC 100172]